MTKKDTKLFIIDTLSTFRLRYVIEAESLEHAYDEIVMRDSGNEDDSFDEVTQKHIGEQIIDGKKISRKDFLKMISDLEYDKKETCSHWMGEKLIRKINYDR